MNIKYSNQHIVNKVLRLATFALFAGRAWQHLFWDAPFRALLWDKETMENFDEFKRSLEWFRSSFPEWHLQIKLVKSTDERFILSKQMPNEEKCARSDYVIVTDTLEHARRQVQNIVKEIRGKISHA